jgi:hypothetical protein
MTSKHDQYLHDTWTIVLLLSQLTRILPSGHSPIPSTILFSSYVWDLIQSHFFSCIKQIYINSYTSLSQSIVNIGTLCTSYHTQPPHLEQYRYFWLDCLWFATNVISFCYIYLFRHACYLLPRKGPSKLFFALYYSQWNRNTGQDTVGYGKWKTTKNVTCNSSRNQH